MDKQKCKKKNNIESPNNKTVADFSILTGYKQNRIFCYALNLSEFCDQNKKR